MTRLLYNKHHKDAPDRAVYIGRGSKWGNPFVIGKDGNRDTVVEKYRLWLWGQLKSGMIDLEDLVELYEKPLVCFCYPANCHGNVLISAANYAKENI